MSLIETLNSALNFSNIASVTTKKQQTEKTKKPKVTFESMKERAEEVIILREAGLPPELIDMDTEEGVALLKDRVDEAADKMTDHPTSDTFSAFRDSVSHLLKYLDYKNYEVTERKRVGKAGKERVYKGVSPYFSERREPPAYKRIKVINDRLNEIASMILQNHKDKLLMLEKIGEIKGLIVDILAS